MTTAKLIRRMKARRPAERALFWALAAGLSVLFAVLAFTPGIGYTRVNVVKIPEAPNPLVWDLNPALWFPYYVSGTLEVGFIPPTASNQGLLPPQEFAWLLVLTILFWVGLSIVISKTLALVVFRIRGGRAEGETLALSMR